MKNNKLRVSLHAGALLAMTSANYQLAADQVEYAAKAPGIMASQEWALYSAASSESTETSQEFKFGQYCDNQALTTPALSDSGFEYKISAAAQCKDAVYHWLDHIVYKYHPLRPESSTEMDRTYIEYETILARELTTPPFLANVDQDNWYELHTTAYWEFPDHSYKMSYEIHSIHDLAATFLAMPRDTNGDGKFMHCVGTEHPACDSSSITVELPISMTLVLGEPVESAADVRIQHMTAQLTLGGKEVACSDVVEVDVGDNYQAIRMESGLYREVKVPSQGVLSVDFGHQCLESSSDVRLKIATSIQLRGTNISGLSDYVDGIILFAP